MFLAGGLAFVATRALSGSGEGSVELVAADETGSSPFTPSASRVDDDAVARALDTVTDRAAPGDADRRLALTPISVGTEPAFASGSTICDKARLAAALASDDDARDAWSSLMGIEEDEVQTTLDSFTPLVLLHDTAVTNSRYANGEPSTFQAVLQAGTPVLVDASGQPRVRCTCGNPLSAAATGPEAKITGPRWEQFRPGRVVTLHPSPSEGAEIPTVDLATGGASSIVLGGEPTPTPSLTTTTSTTAPPATVTTTTAPPPTSAVPMRVFDEPDDLIDAFLTAWATNDARLLATLPIPSGLVSALGPMPGDSWMSDCDAVSRSGGGICRVEVGENHPDHWVTLAHFDFKVELKDVDGWNITDGEQTL